MIFGWTCSFSVLLRAGQPLGTRMSTMWAFATVRRVTQPIGSAPASRADLGSVERLRGQGVLVNRRHQGVRS
jgi:hypothetical protein